MATLNRQRLAIHASFSGMRAQANWLDIDPESSAMAGLFHAQSIQNTNRRQLTLRDLERRAKKYKLGEIVKRIGLLLSFLITFWVLQAPGQSLKIENSLPQIDGVGFGLPLSSPGDPFTRGNTGG